MSVATETVLETFSQFQTGVYYEGGSPQKGRRRTGVGSVTWPDGTRYTGQIVDNHRHGQGVQEWPDTSRYEGDYVDDNMHGHGRYSWTCGEVYEGQFYKGRRHGCGCYTWPDGSAYTGMFYVDKKEGYGTMTYPSGQVFEGLYKDNEREGPGMLSYPDGRRDVGIWRRQHLVRLCTAAPLKGAFTLAAHGLTASSADTRPPLPPISPVRHRRQFVESPPISVQLASHVTCDDVTELEEDAEAAAAEGEAAAEYGRRVSFDPDPDVIAAAILHDDFPTSSLAADLQKYDEAFLSAACTGSELQQQQQQLTAAASNRSAIQLTRDEVPTTTPQPTMSSQHIIAQPVASGTTIHSMPSLRSVTSEIVTSSHIINPSIDGAQLPRSPLPQQQLLQQQEQKLGLQKSTSKSGQRQKSPKTNDPKQQKVSDEVPVKNETPSTVAMLRHVLRHRLLQSSVHFDVDAIVRGDCAVTAAAAKTTSRPASSASRSASAMSIASASPVARAKAERRRGPLEMMAEQLIVAGESGDVETVRSLLDTGRVCADVADVNGQTALHAAAVNGRRDVINCLLDNGADVNRLTDDGSSSLIACFVLLYPASRFSDSTADRDSQQRPDKVDGEVGVQFGGTAAAASQAKSVDKRSTLQNVQTNEELKATRTASRTIGQLVVRRGRHNDVEELLAVGRCIEFYFNASGQLVSVDASGNVALVERTRLTLDPIDENSTLVRAGGKWRTESAKRKTTPPSTPAAADRERKTAAATATHGKASERRVEEVGAEPPTVAMAENGNNGKTAAAAAAVAEVDKEAAEQRRLDELRETVLLLLRRGADPNGCSVPGLPALLLLPVRCSDPLVVQAMLAAGANPNVITDSGLTALHITSGTSGPEAITIVQLLLDAGADPDIRAPQDDSYYNNFLEGEWLQDAISDDAASKLGGRTALHIACSRTDNFQDATEVVKLLLSHNARTDLTTNGHSPLTLAIVAGNDDAVKALLAGGADPSQALTHGIGSALCTTTQPAQELLRPLEPRIALLEVLLNAGADILAPIAFGPQRLVGTVMDYIHYVHSLDAKPPPVDKSLNAAARAAQATKFQRVQDDRNRIVEYLADKFRAKATSKQKELDELEWERKKARASLQDAKQRSSIDDLADDNNNMTTTTTTNEPIVIVVDEQTSAVWSGAANAPTQQPLRYCYYCCRSQNVELTACTQCQRVLFCSETCQLKALDSFHKQECLVYAALKSSEKYRDLEADYDPECLERLLRGRKKRDGEDEDEYGVGLDGKIRKGKQGRKGHRDGDDSDSDDDDDDDSDSDSDDDEDGSGRGRSGRRGKKKDGGKGGKGGKGGRGKDGKHHRSKDGKDGKGGKSKKGRNRDGSRGDKTKKKFDSRRQGTPDGFYDWDNSRGRDRDGRKGGRRGRSGSGRRGRGGAGAGQGGRGKKGGAGRGAGGRWGAGGPGGGRGRGHVDECAPEPKRGPYFPSLNFTCGLSDECWLGNYSYV